MWAFGSYSAQNWLFYWYLIEVESEPAYLDALETKHILPKEDQTKESPTKAEEQSDKEQELEPVENSKADKDRLV